MPRRAGNPETILEALDPAWRPALDEACQALGVPLDRILELASTVAFEVVSSRVRKDEGVSQRVADIAAAIELDVDEGTIRRRIQRLREGGGDKLSQPPPRGLARVPTERSRDSRLGS